MGFQMSDLIVTRPGNDDDNVQQSPFDAIRCSHANGVEYWSARELMTVLGYDTYRRFEDAMERAKASSKALGHNVSDLFVDVDKMVDIGSGATRLINDIHLTRYAAYLTAMNGDPRKSEIAAAQTYFAVKTREAEVAPVVDATPFGLIKMLAEQGGLLEKRVEALEAKVNETPTRSTPPGAVTATSLNVPPSIDTAMYPISGWLYGVLGITDSDVRYRAYLGQQVSRAAGSTVEPGQVSHHYYENGAKTYPGWLINQVFVKSISPFEWRKRTLKRAKDKRLVEKEANKPHLQIVEPFVEPQNDEQQG